MNSMGTSRDLRLHSRVENTRESNQLPPVFEFTLEQIKERFSQNIVSIETQFETFNLLIEQHKIDAAKNILRSQIVFLESALDFYIHEISKIAMKNMLEGHWKKSDQYRNFKVPMSCLEKALDDDETSDWFLEHINSAYSESVFLGFEKFRDQINTLGIACSSVLENAFSEQGHQEACIRYGKKIIRDLYTRRNQIAHQSDREHRTAEIANIEEADVRISIENVKRIIEAIHIIALSKDTEQ